jgi:cytochrome c oxidase subunit II
MRCMHRLVGAVAATLLSASSWADQTGQIPTPWGLNMTKGVTASAETAYSMHMLMFWLCVVIGIIVFGAMFYSMFAHRKSRGVKPAQFSHSMLAETIWTVIPILILVVMAYPATKALIKMSDASGSTMTVKITGYQWKWRYDYVEDRLGFVSTLDAKSNEIRQTGVNPSTWVKPATAHNASLDQNAYLLDVDRPLIVPTKTKIRFLITADDVIHAWWVPALGWKKDAIPGMVNEAWTYIDKPGVYRGQCAELCGKDHGFMPIVVHAVPVDEYKRQIAALKLELQGKPADAQLADGAAAPATIEASTAGIAQ